MKAVESMQDLLDRKMGAPCRLCSQIHRAPTPCNREALNAKIGRLLEANAMIPALISSNKEATELAQSYRDLLFRADQAHGILMGILEKHGETGEQIKFEYLRELDRWAQGKELTSQGTEEQLPLFNPEQSTSQETEIKSSTTHQIGSDLGLGF